MLRAWAMEMLWMCALLRSSHLGQNDIKYPHSKLKRILSHFACGDTGEQYLKAVREEVWVREAP